jgi:hypothetical protein
MTKPENRNYHSGADAVTRVSEWQKAHPEYRARQRVKRSARAAALQDLYNVQPPESTQELLVLPESSEISVLPVQPALQDFINAQPLVFVGLISHFFNLTLQDDIANTTRSLQKLGEDIANGRKPDEFLKTDHLFRAHAAVACPI